MQPKILKNLPPVPMPRPKPMPPGGAGGPEQTLSPSMDEETLRQTIMNAMTQKMGPEAVQKLLQPGDMGAEGAMGAPGMPPDQAAMGMEEMLDPTAPGASGAAPLPVAGPSMFSVGNIPVSDEMLAGEDPGPTPPAAEERFAAGIGAMDRQHAKNMANNRAIAKRLGASPHDVMAQMPGAYSGEQSPPPPGSRQAMIDALLKGKMGMQ